MRAKLEQSRHLNQLPQKSYCQAGDTNDGVHRLVFKTMDAIPVGGTIPQRFRARMETATLIFQNAARN
jgi:hypothetical protein